MARLQLGQVSRACKNCGAEFSFSRSGRGLARLHCSEECAGAYSAKHRATTYSPCTVDGCDRPANRVGAGLCETHYYRLRRNGQTALPKRVIPELAEHSNGYKLLYAPSHPLSGSQPRVYEHRAVYYAAHGDGPFKCYHCGVVVTWGDMHVDHMNDCPDDNRIENLVASCPGCNTRRGYWKVKRSHRSKSRWQITWQGKTQHVGDWAEQLRLPTHVLKWRLERWPVDRAMTEAVHATGPSSRKRTLGQVHPDAGGGSVL